ncbi:MAG TPA: hypothetical protein VMB21_00750 [Candidatus Limnocylindria bacterium]|jgi:hypothetical protein|nr:hypothetical protein [Candidatus Limnocylindria bacterium]
MNEGNNMKKTATLPVMELRETLRRFTWLVGMLAVITTVTALTHDSFGRLIEQRQDAGRLLRHTGAMLAQR